MANPMIRLRWAVLVWAAIFGAIGARLLFSTRTGSVYPIFAAAGGRWLAGEEIYIEPTAELDHFRYSPTVTAFFAPWSLLPPRLGEIVWRGVSAAVFFGALTAWCRWRRQRPSMGAVLLFVAPLAIGGLNNGQCNALVTGLLLFAVVAFAGDRWTLAAAAVTAATLFKGYPIALGLLLCLVEPRRFSSRLAACLFVGMAIPYLFQRPDYVTSQYASFFAHVSADDRTQYDVYAGYRDLHMLLRIAGIHLSMPAYRLVETLLGLTCAVVVVTGRRRGWDTRTAVTACLSLGSCWMTLAGPATESCTYVLLAPALAQAVLDAAERPRWQRLLVYASFACFAVSAATVWFPGWFAHPVQATGIQPLAALLLTIHFATDSLRRPRPASDYQFEAEVPRAA
jgi:hypothetical protein